MKKNGGLSNTARVLREYGTLAEVLVVIGCLFFLPLVSLIAYRVFSDQFTWGSTLLQALGCFVLVVVSLFLDGFVEPLEEALIPHKAIRYTLDVLVWVIIFACFFSFWTPLVPAFILAAISTAVWGTVSLLVMKRYETLLAED